MILPQLLSLNAFMCQANTLLTFVMIIFGCFRDILLFLTSIFLLSNFSWSKCLHEIMIREKDHCRNIVVVVLIARSTCDASFIRTLGSIFPHEKNKLSLNVKFLCVVIKNIYVILFSLSITIIRY